MTRLIQTENDLKNATIGTIAIDRKGLSWQKVRKGNGFNYWATPNSHAQESTMNDWLPLLVVYEPAEPPLIDFDYTEIPAPPQTLKKTER